MIGCWTQDGSAPVLVITRLAPSVAAELPARLVAMRHCCRRYPRSCRNPELMGYTSIAGGLVEHHTRAEPASPILTAG